jgi:hypothetical protein
MTHSKSTFVWQHVKPLEYLQFPWRFMNLAMFLASMAAGAFGLIKNKFVIGLALALVIITNGIYFHPREWQSEMTDQQKFSGRSWYLLTTNGIFDYLPKGANQPPADPPAGDISIIDGLAQVIKIAKTTNRQEYLIEAKSPVEAQVETYYFPGWHAWLDGQPQTIDPTRDPLLGRMKFTIPTGKHNLSLKFTDTPVRKISDLISLVAWLSFAWIIINSWKKKYYPGK